MDTLAVTVHLGFDEVIGRLRTALADQGFGVLTEIDLAATLNEKLGLELPAQRILGACNPALAAQALAAEPSIAVLLPCNVVVRAVDDVTEVEAMDPALLGQLIDNPELAAISDLARVRLRQVLSAVRAAGTVDERV